MEAVLRRNLPASERKKEMLEAALDLFALKGTGITVQELADKIGVTQPLVHRYFPVKADLLHAIRETLSEAHWNPEWERMLSDRTRPLQERLEEFYEIYLGEVYKDRWFRGFTFAALDEPTFASDYLKSFQNRLFRPVASAAREMNGFPPEEAIPFFGREMELIWSMHSTMAMMGVRKHIYKMIPGEDMMTVMRDQIQCYILFVPVLLAKLMPRS